MKASIKFVVMALAFSLATATYAQTVVVPVDPTNPTVYDGTCSVNMVTSFQTTTSATGSGGFSCSGKFSKSVTASLSMETLDTATGTLASTGTYGSVVLTWPRRIQDCSAGYCVFIRTEPIPSDYGLNTAYHYLGAYRTKLTVSWETGYKYCDPLGNCWAQKKSITMYSPSLFGPGGAAAAN